MANRVGPKGQVVIEKELRDQLGVQPGWVALQRLVGDRVEISFVPPAHNRSLLGALAGHTDVRVPPGEDWAQAKETAWDRAARGKMSLEERGE
jgi:bifunctional DNA-binding transcriptional regulator/antitoxin component of YhaV-PrlF toxin-antitoxin module